MSRQEVYIKVALILEDYLRLQPGEVKPTSHVVNELGADSLALVELGFKFMETFGIGMIDTVEQLLIVDNLVGHIHAQRAALEQT